MSAEQSSVTGDANVLRNVFDRVFSAAAHADMKRTLELVGPGTPGAQAYRNFVKSADGADAQDVSAKMTAFFNAAQGLGDLAESDPETKIHASLYKDLEAAYRSPT